VVVSRRGWFIALLVPVLAAAAVFAWRRLEGKAPEIRAPEALVVGTAPRGLTIEVADQGSGLREVVAVLSHAGGDQTLASRAFSGGALSGSETGEGAAAIELAVDASGLPRDADQAFLRITARDWSWRGWLSGNQTQVDIPVRIDRRPPRISVATGLTYSRRGGSGVVAYSIGEPVVRDGVEVGGTFFPGFAWGDGRVAVYAIPTDAPPNPEIRVVAEDEAGNVARAAWAVVVKEIPLPTAQVTLPESFLTDKVPDLAGAEGIDVSDPEQAFAQINTEVRQRNEARIREALAEPVADKLWDGAFEQWANSKVTSRFAEQRTYFVGGRSNSQATHYGYDLAATQAAPVTAAAAGKVAHAGEIGIYGNCVIIDHGLGVATLYGHLSSLDVSAGDSVTKGQSLGRSGATGLAGGDHLHFAVLVSGVYVDPLEWWDPEWMAKNVDARLPPRP
jgi:murein DD-endopeptidase MepM/ murein hydrolase activator NlpD